MKVLMYVFPFILISCSTLQDQRRELASETFSTNDSLTMKVTRTINSEAHDFSKSSEKSPAFESFSNGLVQIFGQLGSETGISRTEVKLSDTGNIPVKSLKLNRVLLYIQPSHENKLNNWFSRIMKGKKDFGFDFLKKLVIKVSDTEILKHNMKTSQRDVNDKGMIYIAGSQNPALTKKILSSHPEMNDIIERMVVVDDLLFINLKTDVVEEHFTSIISQDSEMIEESGIIFMDYCTKNNCLEIEPADINLAPLLGKEGLVLESIVDTKRVPDSLKLKGFFDMEVKIQSDF